MNLNLINIISNLTQLNFYSIEVKSNEIYVHSINLMQVNFIFFQEIFNELKSYHYSFLHIKFLHMVCIKKLSFIINNMINNLSG